MKRTTRALTASIVAGSVLATLAPASPASATSVPVQITGRASTLPGAVEPAVKGPSNNSWISGNGRFVAFMSSATNLTGDVTDENAKVFVRDRKAKTTELVSVSSNEVVANANSPVDHDRRLDISDDGRYVAFSSLASNLGPDGDATGDIFVRDRQAGTTSLISVSSAEASTDAGSFAPTMSADGRYVAFMSQATNLVAGDTNASMDVFRRDRQTTTTVRVSLHDNDAQSPTGGSTPVMDDSGNKVAFVSATKLNAIDPNSTSDVFVRDIGAGSTTVGSVNKDGWAAGESTDPAISGDGTAVAFSSPIMVSDGITNATKHIYLRRNGITTRQTVRTDGLIVAGDSYQPTLSANGLAIAFWSNSNSLVANDTGEQDVFFRRWVGMGPFVDETAFIQRQLVDFTGSASPGQVTAPKAAIDAGASPEHWLVGLAYAPAFAGKAPAAIRLYAAYFDRLPDKGGLTYWVNKLEGGASLDQVSASFAGSNEFTTKYGNTTDAQFVTLVYQNVLERTPDAAGLQFWVAKLAGGMSRGAVMTNFSESGEGKRFMQPEVTATLLGLGMLDAIPTGSLLTAMLAAARTDSPEAAAQVIVDSAAYYDATH